MPIVKHEWSGCTGISHYPPNREKINEVLTYHLSSAESFYWECDVLGSTTSLKCLSAEWVSIFNEFTQTSDTDAGSRRHAAMFCTGKQHETWTRYCEQFLTEKPWKSPVEDSRAFSSLYSWMTLWSPPLQQWKADLNIEQEIKFYVLQSRDHGVYVSYQQMLINIWCFSNSTGP